MSKEKGMYLEVIDFDELYRMMSDEALFVNDFDVRTKEGKEALNEKLHVRYDGDTLDILPSCECGEVTGQYNVGVRCGVCRTKVASVTERPLESALWIRLPKGVNAFVHPAVWTVLSNAFSLKQAGFNLIEWLTNPSCSPNRKARPIVDKISSFNIKRGLNNFVENFDEIMDILLKVNPTNNSPAQRDELAEYIRINRDRIFCHFIPIPSRLTFIVEGTPMGDYADTSLRGAMDAIRTITSVECSVVSVSQRVREQRTAKTVQMLADYYSAFIKTNLATKKGWIRKQVLGSRLHFTFRAVITSLSDNHAYDELHLPWSMSVMAFRTHLITHMLRMRVTAQQAERYNLDPDLVGRGFTPGECVELLNSYTLRYHPLIDELFKRILAETPGGKGYPVLFSRNPTLQRGSVYMMRVTRIKPDPHDNTIAFSVLALAAPNRSN